MVLVNNINIALAEKIYSMCEKWGKKLENGSATLLLNAGFPLKDVTSILDNLASFGCFAPGFIPPEVGMYNILSYLVEKELNGINYTFLPDRNIISRLAATAQLGAPRRMDNPTKIAVSVMAFAQAMDFQIEPSIAFHELAHKQGNVSASIELAQFRCADAEQVFNWIDVALGRETLIRQQAPIDEPLPNLAHPLRRWQRNYVCALKIAELELKQLTQVKKLHALTDWMEDSYFIAAPALMTAAYYYGPKSRRHGMFKQLRSEKRNLALEGVKNSAWDITYLSDFAYRINAASEPTDRYIFVSADRALLWPASLISDPFEIGSSRGLGAALEESWSRREAAEVFDRLRSVVMTASSSPAASRKSLSDAELQELIEIGETKILR